MKKKEGGIAHEQKKKLIEELESVRKQAVYSMLVIAYWWTYSNLNPSETQIMQTEIRSFS